MEQILAWPVNRPATKDRSRWENGPLRSPKGDKNWSIATNTSFAPDRIRALATTSYLTENDHRWLATRIVEAVRAREPRYQALIPRLVGGRPPRSVLRQGRRRRSVCACVNNEPAIRALACTEEMELASARLRYLSAIAVLLPTVAVSHVLAAMADDEERHAELAWRIVAWARRTATRPTRTASSSRPPFSYAPQRNGRMFALSSGSRALRSAASNAAIASAVRPVRCSDLASSIRLVDMARHSMR